MGPLAVAEVLKLAASNDSTKFNDVIDIFAKRLDMANTRVVGLASLVNLSQSSFNGFRNATLVKRFFSLLSFAKQWQTDSATIANLSSNNLSGVVESLLRTRYGYSDAEWIGVQRDIENPIRQQQRNALVAELIRLKPQFKNAHDIYEHYLIDPIVAPCMKTTLVLEAVTATQLFAQRVLFGVEKYRDNSNIEHTLIASEALKDQWTWIRNYRVWEANRKVFLFPQNWLYPELRDDKSSSFSLLEAELGKGELDAELANGAFGKFLDDVVQLARIQVLGMCMDSKGEAPILYVIGRTPNPPYAFYWRKCVGYGTTLAEWSPWYRIELDIQGEHVLVYVQHRTLHLAWPLIKRDGSDKAFTLSYYWSRLSGQNWESSQVSAVAFNLPELAFISIADSFTFRCSQPTEDETKFICFASAILESTHSTPPLQVITRPRDEAATQENKLAVIEQWVSRFGIVHFVDPSHDSLPTRVYGYNPAAWSYSSAADNWTYINAVHIVSWEVWIAAKASNGTVSYVKITRDPGGSTNPKFRLQSSVDNAACSSHTLNEDLVVCIATHSNITRIPPIECAAEYRGFPSQKLSLGEIQQGRFVHSQLVFVIDPPANNIPTLAELGVADPSVLIPVAEFTIDRTGESRWNNAAANSTPIVLPGTVYLRNGLQGGAEGSWPLALPLAGNYAVMPPFKSVSNEPAKQDYWVLGTSDLESAANGGMTWWYKHQDGNSCFISIDSSVRPITARLIPSSYTEASQFRKGWRNRADIEEGQYLPINFGASTLPEPKATSLIQSWQELKNGAMAFNQALPYACYNWEVFFHAPLLIADQLSKQHQFEDAERWLRYVFDPTSTEPETNATRFLKFRVFKELDTHTQVIDDLKAIAQVASGYYNDTDISKINSIIDRWRQLPFRPFVIARGRHIAFLWRTLFAYVDNLITWADSLYRRDTRESNNEAMMLYVLAYRILGRRPRQMDSTSKKVAHTYDQLAGKLDAFSNYWVDVATRAGGYAIQTGGRWLELVDKQPPTSVGGLLFCMPHNDKLDRYWNVIEERLFNLRHCRNIEGVARDLPLLDPPIDPELLIRATAAGLDLNSVVAGLYATPPHYRYGVLAARATELIGETKSLGAAMLSAMEKRDAEQLSQLRSTNELSLLQQVGALKALQIKEAEANIAALRTSRKSAEARYRQYQRLLGLDNTTPEEGGSAGEVAMLGQLDKGNSSPRSGLGLITEEGQQYKGIEEANTWSTAATIAKIAGGASHLAASIVAGTPAGISPTTGAPTVAVKIPEAIGSAASLIGDSFSFVSQGWRTYAEQQGMLAGHLRRRDEWAFQSNQVVRELKQIDKQILANQIRIDITKKELDNHQLQLEQSRAVDEVMRSKFTNVQLYDWMSKELYGLYNYAYRMALEMGRRAQRAAEKELGLRTMTLDKISNGHWNSMKQGLLAGERLHQDLKRLDESYMDMNKREFELTKHISLRRLDPAALADLRITRTVDGERVNQCLIEIPEWLFDLDAPGHYLRRIKSVAISIPCVTGPYSSVNSKLTLLTSSIRYEKDPAIPLQDTLGATEAVVTSTANADSGMFETQLRDERFLPFEGRGVISTWRLELPAKYKQFDYATISDVILTLRYTARDGGDQLKQTALNGIPNVDATTPRNFSLLISCRSDFASDWVRAKADGTNLSIRFGQELLPYWMLNATPVSAKKMVLVANTEPQFESITWTRTDPVQIGSVSNCEDILVMFEVQLP